MGFSSTEEKVLAITPKCSASLSMPLSLFLISEIYSDHRSSRGSNAIQRALLGMSTIDFLSSSGWFLSSWAVPRGSFALSAGNRASCNYQGFLLQLAIGAPLYNSSLALFYLLMIKYNWTDSKLREIEVWVHVAILSFSLGTAILLLPLKQYNHIGAVCWVIGDPDDCGHSSFRSSDVPCERGNYAWIYGLSLFYGPLWICIILCSYSMALVYFKVQKTMRRGNRYSLSRRMDNAQRSETDIVAQQAILYTLSFLITWMPSTVWSVAHWFQFSAFWLDFLAGLAEPLQGFWNILIFARNRPSTRDKLRRAASVLTCGFVTPKLTRERAVNSLSRRATVGRNSARSTKVSLVSVLESQVTGQEHPWAVAEPAGPLSYELSCESRCSAHDGTNERGGGSGLEPMEEEPEEARLSFPELPLQDSAAPDNTTTYHEDYIFAASVPNPLKMSNSQALEQEIVFETDTKIRHPTVQAQNDASEKSIQRQEPLHELNDAKDTEGSTFVVDYSSSSSASRS